MSARGRTSVTWNANPHTLAKIAILKRYLLAWFQIFGRTRTGQDLLYVDGFAGPGHYANHNEGSPVAALVAAREVLAASGSAWKAGDIHCAFIEADRATAAHLNEHLEPFLSTPRLHVRILHDEFARGVSRLKAQRPASFAGRQPLFVFVDPFGATGVPFSMIRDILGSPASEVLINFDADGIERIMRAGMAAKSDPVLTNVFGDESWRESLSRGTAFRDRCLLAVELYKSRLRALPNVRYVFSFEMLTSRTRVGQTGYFLIFASQHPRGLGKMKEAMKGMDQAGDYRFSNARVGQTTMFRFDRPEDFSPLLLARFAGRRGVPYPNPEILDFALNETPFVNPKSMLKTLEEQGSIRVASADPKRRKGTFNEQKRLYIDFLEGHPHG